MVVLAVIGYLGMRGAFEEGLPVFQSGTFINGFYETWPIVYGEEAYGFARTGQTIVNVPDAKLIKIADKICNARDVGFAPAQGWSLDRRREYLDWTEQVVSRCKGALPALDDRYAAVLEEARAQLEAEQRRDQP